MRQGGLLRRVENSISILVQSEQQVRSNTSNQQQLLDGLQRAVYGCIRGGESHVIVPLRTVFSRVVVFIHEI